MNKIGEMKVEISADFKNLDDELHEAMIKMNKFPSGINWIDSSRFNGFLARVYYPGKIISKGFSVSIYGSSKEALKAALKWRNDQIKSDPPPPRKPYRTEPIASNTSGYNGISYTFVRERNGKKTPVISVSYALRPNEPRVKKFRIHLFASEAEALDEALKFRKEKEAEAEKIRKRLKLWPYN